MASPRTVIGTLTLVGGMLALGLTSTGAQAAAKKAPPPEPVKVITKSKICLVLPKAQLGQGSSGVDVAEPVRQSLTVYLSGPATEILPLSSRVPLQINAEAAQMGCEYVLTSSVVQKKGGGGMGFGKMLAAAAPVAGMLPGLGAMSGRGGLNAGAMLASQAGNMMASAAATSAMQSAQEEAMSAITGASQSNIKKGDQVTLEYTLLRVGETQPVGTQKAVAKATEDGMDLLSPLLEQAATEVITAINTPAVAAAN